MCRLLPSEVHRGRPPQARLVIPWWHHLRKCQDLADLAGSCNIVIDLGKDHNSQGIYLSGREQISHLSKYGKNRHKGALIFTRSPASQAHSRCGELARILASRASPRSLTICPTIAGQMPMVGGEGRRQLLDPQNYQTPLFDVPGFLFSCGPGYITSSCSLRERGTRKK